MKWMKAKNNQEKYPGRKAQFQYKSEVSLEKMQAQFLEVVQNCELNIEFTSLLTLGELGLWVTQCHVRWGNKWNLESSQVGGKKKKENLLLCLQ